MAYPMGYSKFSFKTIILIQIDSYTVTLVIQDYLYLHVGPNL